MSLRLTVLGCSGSYAGPGEACSGYLVEGDGTRVWLDAGAGTLGNLQRHVALRDLDAIVVSHSHPDHWVELPIVRNALRYVLDRSDVPVYTTAAVRSLVETVAGGGVEPTFRWTVLSDGDTFDIGGLRWRCSRTDHPVETLAMRVEASSGSILYSADTGPGWSPKALGSADLFLCEASLSAGDEGAFDHLHLSAAQAGTMAADAGVDRLVITHHVPGVDVDQQRRDAEAAFGRPVEVARTGATFDI